MSKQEILKEQFLAAAPEHGKALAIGDYKKANKIHRQLHSLYKQAKDENQAAFFSEVLNEKDENVRLWAATFTLRIFPELAENCLEKLTELPGITSSTAKSLLQLWKKGKLELL